MIALSIALNECMATDIALNQSCSPMCTVALPGIERWQKRLVETVEEFCAARSPPSSRMPAGADGCAAQAKPGSSAPVDPLSSNHDPAGSPSTSITSGDEHVPWLLSRGNKPLTPKDLAVHEAELRNVRNEMTSIITHEIGQLNRISVAIRRMQSITKDIRVRNCAHEPRYLRSDLILNYGYEDGQLPIL
jgi:hypothetical protein